MSKTDRAMSDPLRYQSSGDTDAELVVAARDGDRHAFTRLVERYHSRVCSFAAALTSDPSQCEDIAQDAFILAWRNLSRLENPHRFRSWILTITRNASRRAQRREGPVAPSPLPLSPPGASLPSSDPSPLERAIGREEETMLWRALAAIP